MFFTKKYKLGNLKNLDEITLQDMIDNPIWVNDLSGESLNNFDETSERPVINSNDLKTKLISKYVSVTILIKIVPTNLYGSANYEESNRLSSIVVWKDNRWTDIGKLITNNMEIISIPTINHNSNVTFKYIHKDEMAVKKELI